VFQLTEQNIREVEEKRAQDLKDKAAAIAAKQEIFESIKKDADNEVLEVVDETEGVEVIGKPSISAKVEQPMWSFFENNPSRDTNEDFTHEIYPDVDNDEGDEQFYKDPLLAADLPNIDDRETPTISLFPTTGKRKALGKKKPNFRTKRNK
jgi:acetyl-CoA carboxylase alpha subunit